MSPCWQVEKSETSRIVLLSVSTASPVSNVRLAFIRHWSRCLSRCPLLPLIKVWTNGFWIDNFLQAIFGIDACPPHYRSMLSSPWTWIIHTHTESGFLLLHLCRLSFVSSFLHYISDSFQLSYSCLDIFCVEQIVSFCHCCILGGLMKP